MTEPQPPDLVGAQLRVDVAVQQLIQPTTVEITRDVEPASSRQVGVSSSTYVRTENVPVPALLEQLQDAVAGTGGSNGARGVGAHRSPIALGAAALVADIERTVRWGRLAHSDGRPLASTLREQLRAWAARSGHWRVTAPDYLLQAATRAEQWVQQARTTLDPPRKFTAVGACPVCGRRIAHVRDDSGEIVRRPALEVDTETESARCIVPGCTGYWPPERLDLLVAVLRQQETERTSVPSPAPRQERAIRRIESE